MKYSNLAFVRFFLLILILFASRAFCQTSGPYPDKVVVRIGTFLGNEQRNYYGNRAPDELGVIWKHNLGSGQTIISRKAGSRIWAGAGWTGQPLLIEEDGHLYLIQGAYDHNLKKIDTHDGSIVWQYKFDDVVKGTGTIWVNNSIDPVTSYIILQGSRLGVGNYLDTKNIPSYRAISYLTGTELWRLDVKRTDSYSRDADGSALILGDTAYIGLENSLFTVFDPDPVKATIKDGMLQPLILQETILYEKTDVSNHFYNVVTESSPSLLGDHIYIASGSGHVYGYNLKKRELDWDFYIGSDMDGSAIITADSCLLISVEKQYIEGPGGAFKLDPLKQPGECVKWYFPVGDSSFASWKGGIIGSIGITDSYVPQQDKQLAAFIGIDGYLYVVKHRKTVEGKLVRGPDGKSLYPTPELVFKKYIGPSISTPIFAGNKLVAAGYNGIYLFSFNEEFNFNLIDKFSASFESTPVAWNGRIYVASRNGNLYCFGAE